MLLISLACMAAGYTLLYAGWRPGQNDEYAHAPWLLWIDAFKALGSEAVATQPKGATLA